jgi:hypothetical protein
MIGLSARTIDFNLLRETVERQLCEIGHLEPKQFPMTQREVVRAGQTCGLYFCVHGPRSVKLTAIADLQNQTVIFYGSDGIRRQSVPLYLHSLAQSKYAA